jgi:hypothetical protein
VEWLGDHANGENAKLTRRLSNYGGRAGAGAAPMPAVMNTHALVGLNDILYLIFKFAVTLRKSFAALTPWLSG